MRRTTIALAAWGALVASGCERVSDATTAAASASALGGVSAASVSSPPSSSTATSRSRPATLADARRLLERFLEEGADHRALTRELAPSPADVDATFEPDLAATARAHYDAVFRELVLTPAPAETELLMWKVTTEDLRAGSGDANKCPPELSALSARLRAGLAFYCFRFVVPAEKRGTSSEGLVHVNGRWVLFPEPWRIP